MQAPAQPRTDPNTLLDSARAHLHARNIPAALASIDQAERAGADPNTCAGDRWQCYMLLGDFERAWEQNDLLRARNAPDPHRFWDGSSWRGQRVMLRCLHGFGDAIQFLRYAPLLKAQAADLTVECAPHIAPLLRLFPGPDRITTWGPDAPAEEPAWDLQMEIMELPYAFRSTLETLPRSVPYLRLPEPLVAAAAQRMDHGGRKRIGLAWAGGEWNRSRSIPFHILKPILQDSGAIFYSLQGGEDNADWDAFCDSHGLQNGSGKPGGSDLKSGSGQHSGFRFYDTADHGSGLLTLAAAISNLDLVITVDTMAAHLAGSLGIPVWLLLQHAADWRWMTERSDSPWYPTMRLYRQPSPGNWPAIIDEVSRALRCSD